MCAEPARPSAAKRRLGVQQCPGMLLEACLARRVPLGVEASEADYEHRVELIDVELFTTLISAELPR